jgi:hypothetical protein
MNRYIREEIKNEDIKETKKTLFYNFHYLIKEKYDSIYEEYTEIIILFGYVCIFGLVQPWLFFLLAIYIYIQVKYIYKI